MERLRRRPLYTSWVVLIIGLVAAALLSPAGDLFWAFAYSAVAVAVAVAVYVALVRQRANPD